MQLVFGAQNVLEMELNLAQHGTSKTLKMEAQKRSKKKLKDA